MQCSVCRKVLGGESIVLIARLATDGSNLYRAGFTRLRDALDVLTPADLCGAVRLCSPECAAAWWSHEFNNQLQINADGDWRRAARDPAAGGGVH